ncbi:MAG: hypothetical protein JW725_04130 [Candidatus Babeliaceae bacterium]|nr:hypothetical protein [Candidatus Babeliaceae bacterium]
MKRFYFAYLLFFGFSLSGAHIWDYVNWVRCPFEQPCTINCGICDARQFVRSYHVLRQLSSIDNLHALWVSDTVREVHGCLVNRCGKAPDAEIKSNKTKTVFYVLTDLDRDAWRYVLHVCDRCYYPSSIRAITLDEGYTAIFGGDIMRFKRNNFEVVFDVALDPEDRPAIEMTRGTIKICLSWCDAPEA